MWSPTHVQVTVQRAKNLIAKGRAGSNDAFVVIQMGKEKFQTSVKEKTLNPEWYEECDLTLQGKDTNVTFTVFHRNVFGLDEFLGQAVIPLQTFESYDRPVNKWYALKGKGDKKEEKYRGEIEVRIAFVVRSLDTQSLNDLNIIKKRRRHSIKELAISVGHKIQKMPNRSFSFRMDNLDPRLRLGKLRERRGSSAGDYIRNSHAETNDTDNFPEDVEKFSHLRMKKSGSLYSSTLSLPPSAMITSSIREVGSLENISQVEEEQCPTDSSESPNFQNEPHYLWMKSGVLLSQSGTLSSLPTSRVPSSQPGTQSTSVMKRSKRFSIGSLSETKSYGHGEWTTRVLSHMKESPLARSETNLSGSSPNELPISPERKSKLDVFRNNLRRHTLHLSEPPDLSPLKINGSPNKGRPESSPSNLLKDYSKVFPEGVPQELIHQYEKMNHQDLVILAIKQQANIESQRDKIMDLETYIDNLLVRVMETTPRLLQTPYKPPNPACYR